MERGEAVLLSYSVLNIKWIPIKSCELKYI